MITREYLENRILQLTAARNKLLSDVSGNNGAIQLCEQLLAQLDAEKAEALGHEAEQQGQTEVKAPKANGGKPAP